MSKTRRPPNLLLRDGTRLCLADITLHPATSRACGHFHMATVSRGSFVSFLDTQHWLFATLKGGEYVDVWTLSRNDLRCAGVFRKVKQRLQAKLRWAAKEGLQRDVWVRAGLSIDWGC